MGTCCEKRGKSSAIQQVNVRDDRVTEVVKAVAGMRRSHKKPIKRPCLLGNLHISFLLDSWKKLLNAILGSQETKEEVINGDELLLLFC